MKKHTILSSVAIILYTQVLFAQQDIGSYEARVEEVCVHLLRAGFRDEPDTLRTAFHIRKTIDEPADRFAESVPPRIAKNRLVQAWLFGAPRNRGREEVGRFEGAMRRQYGNASPVILMWLHRQGIRVVSNGDHDPANLALLMNSHWVPALREKVAMTNQYIAGSSLMARLCLVTPAGSRDVAMALGAADAEPTHQEKSVYAKLNALFSHWSEKTEEVAKYPVYLRTYNAAKLYQQGCFAEAAEACRILMEEDKPKHGALIYRCWADSLWRLGRHDEARAVLVEGLSIAAIPPLYLLEAEFALHDGDPAKARQSLRFLTRQPENPAGQSLLARVAAAEGRVTEWTEATINTLFYSYGWEDDYLGPALDAAELAITRAAGKASDAGSVLADVPEP
ncbi:MAG: tetratricopeptide repeat protein [Planctomycetes bacterium]|nr:tetratricopeptide repeat protein [Planctomycetota bacterium]